MIKGFIMRSILVFISSLILCTANQVVSQQFEKIFVDPDWLHAHLAGDSIIILHADKPENYLKGHIPGALFMDQNAYSTIRNGLYLEMPDKADFCEELRIRGIDEGKKVIISSGWDTFAQAFRLYVTFEYFNLNNQVRVLDGGIRGWEAKGFTVSRDSIIATPAKKRMNLIENAQILVDKDWIRSNLGDPSVCILDARREDYYSGREKGNYQRSGHISRAGNLTWTTLVDDHFFLLNQDSLKLLYQRKVGPEKKILIAYCHVALRASVIYTVGKALGYEVRLYDGSYNEWDGLDTSYPVEND